MRKISVISALYLLQILIGNVCLTNLAQAMEGSSAQNTAQMSKAVFECPWSVPEADGTIDATKSPCASGHCIEMPAPEVRCLSTLTTPLVHFIAAGVPWYAEPSFISEISYIPAITESPPPLSPVATVVLRC